MKVFIDDNGGGKYHMSKNKVSDISNPFSTGEGGAYFESNVQAVFLLSLLIDGFSPVLELPTRKLCLQAKRLGFAVDDVVVYAGEAGKDERKLLCQVKHSVVASKNNDTFREIIRAAWNDYNKSYFNKERDCIVLAIHHMANDSKKELHLIHSQACASADAQDFKQRFDVSGVVSKKGKKILDAIKEIIKESNDQRYPTDDELWGFCKVFSLLVFDIDYLESINRILVETLIKLNCSEEPKLIWGSLISYVASRNSMGAVLNINSIDDSIKKYFSKNNAFNPSMPPSPITEIDLFVPSLVLVGSWTENNEFDRTVVEKVSGMKYKEFEAKARDMLLKNPDYLSLNNGIWKIKNRQLLFDQCVEMLFDDKIQAMIDVGIDIFVQEDKALSQNNPVHPFLFQQKYNYSFEIRKGIAAGLSMICNCDLERSPCNVEKTRSLSAFFIRKLIQDCDWKRWVSIKDNLQVISEVNPKEFLSCVEYNITYKPEEILKLFPSKDTGLFKGNNITELLWCLEKLAWIPEYLVTAVRCLGLLENLSYEQTNYSNTPINSIVSILLPWHPQTMADTETRRLALKCLQKDSENVLWNVLLKLLPDGTTFTISNPKPTYIPINISEEKQPDNTTINNEYRFNIDLAIGLAKDRIDRLVFLVDIIRYMKESSINKILDSMENTLVNASSEESFTLWLKLDEQLTRMQSEGIQWPEGMIARIDGVRLKSEPTDIRIKYRRFYLQKRYAFEKGDFSSIWEYLENEKQFAVKEIYDEYGVAETEAFGKSVGNIRDVALKLGISISVSEISDIIKLFHNNKIGEEFFESCINGFVDVNGVSNLLEADLYEYDEPFIAKVLVMIRYTSKLYDVVQQLLTKESLYWEKASFMYVYTEERVENINNVIDKLSEYKRYVTAINILGRSELKTEIGKKKIGNLLRLGGLKKSIGTEQLDSYAVQRLIGWLQEDEPLDIELLSEIEYIYLPILNDYSEIQPRALNTRLNQEPEYFCDMMEMFYKKHSHPDEELKLSEGVRQRLFAILFHYKNVPGTDWNGKFDAEVFADWIKDVKVWSKENNRYEMSMQTIGSGLSYAKLEENGLPREEILQELDFAENDQMRRGYELGIINQRGVYTVDPEGKPEFDLAKHYSEKAQQALNMGYSRYSELLTDISDYFIKEAKHNINSFKKE